MAAFPLRSYPEVRDGRIVMVNVMYDEDTGAEWSEYEERPDLNEPNELPGMPGEMPADAQNSFNLGYSNDYAPRAGQIPNWGSVRGTEDPALAFSKQIPGVGGQGQAGGFYGGGMANEQQKAGLPWQGQNPGSGAALAQQAQQQGGLAGAINTQAPAGQTQNADLIRGLTLFSPDNATASLQHALASMGVSDNPGNPFVQFMKRAAPSLAAAFYVQNALQPGLTADSIGNNPYMFRDYLTNAIKSGTSLSGAASMASKIPDVIAQIRQAGNPNNPMTADQINPFVHALGNMLSSNLGEGTTDLMGALRGALMPRTLAAGYQTGLTGSLGRAQRSLAFDGREEDIWQYLFGERPQSIMGASAAPTPTPPVDPRTGYGVP